MSSSLRNSLGESEVFELVCDYLHAREFYDAERTLIQERKRADEKLAQQGQQEQNQQVNDSPSKGFTHTPSKLESLLERSYVTNLVSGDMFPTRGKRRRTNLDGNTFDEESVEEGKPSAAMEPSVKKELSVSTRIVSFEPCKDDPHGSAVMPLYQTSTFAQKSATEFGQYDYTRSGNPTRAALEKQMAELEYGHRAFAFTSGMAALSCVSRLAKSGDEIILSDDSYGGTYRLLSKVAAKNGISITYVDLSGKSGPSNLRKAISSKTKLVMMESPTNPLQRICDIEALSIVAHEMGALLSVDNTMLSPILQNPLNLGADIVVQSATKFVSGHSDTMSGVVICKDPELCQEVYFYQNAEGTGLAPFDCWLLLRGIKTMGIRVLRAQENSLRIAEFLYNHPAIPSVFYNGLLQNKNVENYQEKKAIHDKQSKGSGSVLCFQTGSLKFSQHIVSKTKLFKITVSFGSVNSLISLPGAMSHASIPEEVRKARSFPEDLVRLSIGIEDPEDLINDLTQAIQTYELKN